jgi:hypothetical protein
LTLQERGGWGAGKDYHAVSHFELCTLSVLYLRVGCEKWCRVAILTHQVQPKHTTHATLHLCSRLGAWSAHDNIYIDNSKRKIYIFACYSTVPLENLQAKPIQRGES